MSTADALCLLLLALLQGHRLGSLLDGPILPGLLQGRAEPSGGGTVLGMGMPAGLWYPGVLGRDSELTLSLA